jgi:hypothetical protein
MAPGVDATAKTVTILHLTVARPPALKIAANVEAQRIAAHLQIPVRQYDRLVKEYPEIVVPAHGLADVRRALGKDAPAVGDFLEDWTVEMEEPDPTTPSSQGSSP